MSNLPPELASMDAAYLEMTQAVQAGHVSVEDALATLAGLSAVDGAGAVWGMNPEGNFTRAHNSSVMGVPTDPSAWVPTQNGSLLAPPGGYNPGGLTSPPPMMGGQPLLSQGVPAAPMMAGGWDDSGFEAPKTLGGGEQGKKSKKAPKASKEPKVASEGGGLAGAVEWVSAHKKVAILVAFGVALLGFSLLQLRGSSEPAQVLPGIEAPEQGQDPGVSIDVSPTQPETDLGGFTTDEGQATDQAQAPSDLPTQADVQGALAAISGGEGELVIIKSDPVGTARAQVVIAGASDTASLSLSDLKKGKGGKVTQSLTVESQDGQPLWRANVTWQQQDGTWKLVTAPNFE